MMADPLAEIVTLLQPSASFSKLVEYTGRWRIRRDVEGKPVYFAVLEGQCRLVRADQPPIIVRAGDFVLSPSTNDQIIESIDAPAQGIAMAPTELSEGRFRVGLADDEVNLRMQIGLCSFASPDAALLVSLLPSMIIARGEPRLAQLLNLVSDETRQSRPGRELVLERLLEVLLIEALRSRGRYRLGAKRRAWAFRQSTRRRVARPACAAGPWLDSRRSCRRSRDVAFGLLCAVHPRRWAAADGISDRLAHGSCEAPIAQPGAWCRTSRRAGRLRLSKHLQHRIRPPRWDVTNAIRSGAHRALIRAMAVAAGLRPENAALVLHSDNATHPPTRRLAAANCVALLDLISAPPKPMMPLTAKRRALTSSCRYSRYGLSTSSIHFMNARTRRDRLLRWATTRDTASARRRKSGRISTSAPLSKYRPTPKSGA